MMVSIIIRTLNEEKYLNHCLNAIRRQKLNFSIEIIVIDSGSDDQTLKIAESHGCLITHIKKSEFSFGKSLNMGCEFANGDIYVFISGHCIPVGENWLEKLVSPIFANQADYTFSRQVGDDRISKYSELKIFEKYYPPKKIQYSPKYFCNNASAAISSAIWRKYRFDEKITGLEDMELARRLTLNDGIVEYVPESCVLHLHEETPKKIRIRFEREAAALESFAPELSLTFKHAITACVSAIIHDLSNLNKVSMRNIRWIFIYRMLQYYGSYVGGKKSREKIENFRKSYYYPK